MKSLVPWRKKEAGGALGTAHPFELLQRQMNDLFSDFFEDFGSGRLPIWSGEESGGLSVRFDVAETDEAVLVTAELPGLDEKDIEVTLDENVLVVRGEKKQEREEKKKSYYFSERSYGQFQRMIPLPAGVHRDQVEARFKKGVLSITLPKSAPPKKDSRRIEIAAG